MAERNGRVENVWTSPAGSRLTTDHLLGDTILNVQSSTDFSGFGGYVVINGSTYQYSTKDSVEIGGLAEGYADTLTLSSGLLAAAALDDTVIVEPFSPQMWAMVLFNDDAPGDQAVIARVPHTLQGWFPNEGIRGYMERESVTLDLIGNEWVIQDVYGKTPQISGETLEPGTTPGENISDGIPPATSPTPAVTGGIGVLHVRWTGLTNADIIEYEVHVSTTDNFVPDATSLYETTAANTSTIRTLPPSGTPLVQGPEGSPTVYYVRIWAKDNDGYATGGYSPDVAASLVRAQQDDISANFVYGGTVVADQIISGDLTASIALLGEISTAEAGRRITISSEDGIRAIDPSDETIVHIPTDEDQDISIKADIIANSITALGPIAMRALTNEISANARLILRGGITTPNSPPVAVPVWSTIAVQPTNPTWGLAGNYFATATRTYQAWFDGTNSGVWAFDNTGAHVTGEEWIESTNPNIYVQSAARLGATIYLLLKDLTAKKWWIRRVNATTHALIGTDFDFGSTVTFSSVAMAFSGTTANLVTVARNVTLDQYRRRGYTLTGETAPSGTGGDALVEGAGLGTAESTTYGEVMDIIETLAEGGMASYNARGDRLFVAYGGSLGVITGVKTYAGGTPLGGDSNYAFPLAYQEVPSMLTYNSGIGTFVSYSRDNGNWNLYDGTRWTTESSSWKVSYTWRDSDATGGTHETDQGPRASLTMKKRARLSVTTPAIPTDPDVANTDDANAVSIYVGRGDGSRTTQYRQATPADGVIQATIQTVAFSGTNPPAANNFPSNTPSAIQSGVGVDLLDSDGDANLRDVLVSGSIGLPADTYNEKTKTDTQTLNPSTSGFVNNTTFTIVYPGGNVDSAFLITASIDIEDNGGNAACAIGLEDSVSGIDLPGVAAFRCAGGGRSTIYQQWGWYPGISADSISLRLTFNNLSTTSTFTIRPNNTKVFFQRLA